MSTRPRPGPDPVPDPVHLDPLTRFLFVPRTVTFLVLGLLLLTYYSHALDVTLTSTSTLSNTKNGIYAVVCVFLGYSAVQGRGSSHLTRPHPSFWKLVHGVMVCYLLFMVFLLFQTVGDARQFLKHLYPELGVELEERAYGASCALLVDDDDGSPTGTRMNWGAIKATLFDEFVVAHTLGWWGKALILRDTSMLWVVSVAFELMELTFQHLLPNFNECWWDSWILDVAVCNAIGIYTGMWTVRYFNGKEYDWAGMGMSAQPTLLAKATRSVLQFTPARYDVFEWGLGTWFRSPKRFLQCFFPAVIILLFEVNHFFLKYELWVPPRNPLNTIRLTVLFLIAVPGIREYYEYIELNDARTPFTRLGVYAWTGVAIAFVEMLMIVKFGRGMFDAPWPTRVLVAWGSVFVLFAIVMPVWVWRSGWEGGGKKWRNRRRQTTAA